MIGENLIVLFLALAVLHILNESPGRLELWLWGLVSPESDEVSEDTSDS